MYYYKRTFDIGTCVIIECIYELDKHERFTLGDIVFSNDSDFSVGNPIELFTSKLELITEEEVFLEIL